MIKDLYNSDASSNTAGSAYHAKCEHNGRRTQTSSALFGSLRPDFTSQLELRLTNLCFILS